tara:strand:+ start:6625 stop:7926 length:1302 start_codon:yes stop_codon:yes gene_type:complete
MSIKTTAINGVSWVFVGNIIISISGILKIFILTKFLTPTDFGLFALVNIVIGFSSIFLDVGFSVAILYKDKLSALEFSSLYWVNFIFCLFIFFILTISSGLVSEMYGDNELKHLIIISAVGIIFSGIGKLFRVQEEKKLNFPILTSIDSVCSIVSLVIAVTLAYFNYGVVSLVYGSLIYMILTNISFFIYGMNKRKNTLLLFSFSSVKSFFSMGLFYTLEQLVNYFSKEMDVLVIGKFYSTETLGFYSLAKQLALKPASLINPIFVKVCTPIFAIIKENKSSLSNAYCKLISTISALNLPFYVLIFIFSEEIIQLLYGSTFIESHVYLRLLSIYMLLLAFRNPLGSLIISTGNTFKGFAWTLVTVCCTIIGLFFTHDNGLLPIISSLILVQAILYVPMFTYIIKPITETRYSNYLLSHLPNYRWIYSSVFLNK